MHGALTVPYKRPIKVFYIKQIIGFAEAHIQEREKQKGKRKMNKYQEYLIVVAPLSEEDGGGFLARVPDLPGCFGDGETQVEAVQDASKAIVEWVDEYEKMGRDIPQPGSAADNLLAQREAEIKLINELRDRLDSSEASMAAMGGDVAVLKVRMGEIERYIKDLLDVVDNAAAWERFEIIAKQTRSQQRELFVLAARS